MKKILFVAIGILILGGLVNYFGLPYVGRSTNTGDLQNAFNEQTNILAGRIALVAGNISSTTKSHCVDAERTHFQTKEFCEDDVVFENTHAPLSAANKAAYAANARNLDAVLKANGWTNDRPGDKFLTFASIDPHSAANGGVGGDLAFHKNIGSVSCNLRAAYQGTIGLAVPKDVFEIDQFSCQKTFSYSMLHLRNYRNNNL